MSGKKKPSMKLEIKKFDPSKVGSESCIVLIGKRASGKSHLLKDLLSYQKNIPIGTVISPTECANEFFQYFIPKMLIHDEYTPELLEKFVTRQRNITEKFKQDKKQYGHSSIDPRGFLILDDCLYDSDWTKDKNIRSCFMNGRHFNILFILTMQYALGIGPNLRGQTDYIFIFSDSIIKNKQRLYEHYCGFFDSFDIFKQVMDQICVDYHCLVIDNRTQSNKIEDKIFWYKAKDTKFHMCDESLWDLQAIEDEKRKNKAFNKNEEDDYDPNVISKSKFSINVKKKC
tara:strand:- start:648 stop:1505 length:858 start_codon:yes stop_codon:yes gene_type:complete